MKPERFRLGRTDPKLDPKGYRTLFLFDLAERYYREANLAQKILGGADNPTQIFPEEQLLVRLETGQLELSPAEFDIVALLEEVRTRLQLVAEGHQIRVRAPERLLVFGDRDRIDQAITNLLSNAIRYSPEGSDIEVNAEHNSDAVHVAVRDQGIGIPKDQQETIFEPFTRTQSSSSHGIGLGLAITKGIVEQHGGTISVESTGVAGEGSTFHFWLPGHGQSAK